MKHNLRTGMQESMDALHFSREQKDAMTASLIQAQKEQKRNKKNHSRKLLLVALAAAMLLVTLTGAAVFTRWSRNAQNRYNPSQEIKEQAEKSGLSVMLEQTAATPDSGDVLSVTDQGITVTAVQSIIDQYRAEITFRVEGFDLPEGRDPWAWDRYTLDGDPHFYTAYGAGFFDGTTRNDNGEWVYAANGQPVESDENDCAIMDWTSPDGSLEFTAYFHFWEGFGDVDGKEFVVNFDAFGLQPETKQEGDFTKTVEGNWELRWKLKRSADTIAITPNAEIGDSGVILLTAEIGQKTIRTTYQLQEHWAGLDTLIPLPQRVYAVRMKDGSIQMCGTTSEGYRSQEDRDKLIYFADADVFDAILDPSQVESLLFFKGWEKDAQGNPSIPIYDAIPVS